MIASLDPYQITTIFIWFMIVSCCLWEVIATVWPGHVASISATVGRAMFHSPALLPLLLTLIVWLLWHFWKSGHQSG
jgi:hypothetical protein